MPAWLKYTLLRIGVFAVALAVLLLVQLPWPLAAAFAAAIALLVSLTLFGRLRAEVATEMARRRPRVDTEDDLVEDAQIAEATAARPTAAQPAAAQPAAAQATAAQPTAPHPATSPHPRQPTADSEGERPAKEDGVSEHGERGELQRGDQLAGGAGGQHDDDRWQA